MGITQSLPIHQADLHLENWTEMVPNTPLPHPSHGRFRTLSNNMTNQLIDQYSLEFHQSSEYLQYVRLFNYRNQYQWLVHGQYLTLQQTRQLCSVTYNTKVYIENIIVRLCHLKDIPYRDSLYILETCLKGFSILYQKMGYFTIIEDLISINHQGIAKVWLNPDLSKHYPYHSYCLSPSERQMVMEIINIIDFNVDKSTQKISILSYFSQNTQDLTFNKALQLLQELAHSLTISIPKYFQAFVEKMREESQSESSANRLTLFKESSVWRLRRNSQTFHSETARTYVEKLNKIDQEAFTPPNKLQINQPIKRQQNFTILEDECEKREQQIKSKPAITFTYDHSEQLPISPVTRVPKKIQWNEESLKDLNLDPEIMADLISYHK